MKRFALKSLFLGLAATALVPSAFAAPAFYNGHYYDIISAPGGTWEAANTAANGMSYLGLGGHLATATSAGEDAFIFSLISGRGFGEVWGGAYQSAGGIQSPTEGWTWVTGEAWSYTNWSPGEPNNNYGPGSENSLGFGWNGGYWNDEGALGNIGGYVVEYEAAAVPEPATLGLLGLGLAGMGFLRRRKSAV